MTDLPTPEQTACMYIGHRLGKVLDQAKEARGDRSVTEILLDGRPFHGTFLHASDLEHLSRVLGLHLYGDTSQLDEIFAFVQAALESMDTWSTSVMRRQISPLPWQTSTYTVHASILSRSWLARAKGTDTITPFLSPPKIILLISTCKYLKM